jgi:hypothetical protein
MRFGDVDFFSPRCAPSALMLLHSAALTRKHTITSRVGRRDLRTFTAIFRPASSFTVITQAGQRFFN